MIDDRTANWADGVHALLPEVDVLCVGDTLAVPWDAAFEIAGDLLEPEALWPKRYRVRRFPSSEQLARLRAVAIDTGRGDVSEPR